MVPSLLLALIAIVLVATGIAMLVRFISYNYIWYEYSNEEFSFYSGIISKKRAHVPYQRIQSINQKATLFQRIAGVCTVSIETAGGASNTAITLPYIENARCGRFAERYNHNAPCSHRRASHHYSCTSDCANHSRCE